MGNVSLSNRAFPRGICSKCTLMQTSSWPWCDSRLQTFESFHPGSQMEEDPIPDEQMAAARSLLRAPLTATEYEGFLILSSRFVDSRGHSRLANLGRIFDTDRAERGAALAASLS